jgi:parallel beta-helix repeat protein
MKQSLMVKISVVLVFISYNVFSQNFVHPGINQTKADLEFMRKQVLSGEQPWKDAYEHLKAKADLTFSPVTFAHVMQGPYSKPDIGGKELSQSAEMAYNCALVWYISQDKAYANKAIEIINAWSYTLWDFDYNNAKVLAGWTGHVFCNAAEILRYTGSGWKSKDIDQFTHMLVAVYYPLMRFYFPQANGNWDGAIMHSVIAIAVFTNNHEMFNNAVNHYLHGPFNSGIFKYVYPSGQCQESTRDQGHVQLGLTEFAGVARIAYTQGVDLFSAGNNRLALGFEYTAKFIQGEKVFCYGDISERSKKFDHDYEQVCRHYSSKGIAMPYTRTGADSLRQKMPLAVLTALRAPDDKEFKTCGAPVAGIIGFPAGASVSTSVKIPADAVWVAPGQSLQKALDEASGTGRWVVAAKGLHTLPGTLRIPSDVTLAGEGLASILFLDPAAGLRDAVVNATDDLKDVTLRDFVIEGAVNVNPASDPNSTRSFRNGANRGAIMFLGQKDEQMKNISFIHLTVRNCTYNGVFVSGAAGVTVEGCDFNENGSGVVPGPQLQHNLLLTHSTHITVKDSRLVTSPYGSGIYMSHCSDVSVTNNEIARNAFFGIGIAESDNISISGNLIEANDRSGIMMEFFDKGSENITIRKNQIQYNTGFAIESYVTRNCLAKDNVCEGNGTDKVQEKISNEKIMVMH